MNALKIRFASCALAMGFVALCSEEAQGQFANRDSRRIVSGLSPGPSFSMRPHQNLLHLSYPKKVSFGLAVPIDYPADFFPFLSTTRRLDLDRLLLSGQDAAGRGVLAWIRAEGDLPSQWSILDIYMQPNSDFVGVSFSKKAQRLYVLDLNSKAIYSAPFATDALTLPTAWTLLAPSSQFGGTDDLHMRALGIDDKGEHPRLFVYYVNDAPRDILIVIDTPSGPEFDTYSHPSETRCARIAARQLMLGSSSVPLSGPPSETAELLRMDGPNGIEVVGSVQLDASGHGSVATSTKQLVFGGVYGARNQSNLQPSAPFLSPEKRWGSAQSLIDGNQIQPLRMLGLTAYVGSPYFRIPGSIEVEQESEAPAHSYPAILLVGDSSSEIIDVEGTSLLSSRFSFSTSIQTYSAHQPGFGVVPLPIPEDSLFSGMELRYQWLVDDGDGLRVSDIAGILIRNTMWAPPGNEDALSIIGPLLSPKAEPAPHATSFQAWLEQSGSKRFSEEEWISLTSRLWR